MESGGNENFLKFVEKVVFKIYVDVICSCFSEALHLWSEKRKIKSFLNVENPFQLVHFWCFHRFGTQNLF